MHFDYSPNSPFHQYTNTLQGERCHEGVKKVSEKCLWPWKGVRCQSKHKIYIPKNNLFIYFLFICKDYIEEHYRGQHLEISLITSSGVQCVVFLPAVGGDFKGPSVLCDSGLPDFEVMMCCHQYWTGGFHSRCNDFCGTGAAACCSLCVIKQRGGVSLCCWN